MLGRNAQHAQLETNVLRQRWAIWQRVLGDFTAVKVKSPAPNAQLDFIAQMEVPQIQQCVPEVSNLRSVPLE